MAKGRKPKGDKLLKFHIVLCLHPIADADIIAALEAAKSRGRLVREWIRHGRNTAKQTVSEEEKPDLSDLGIEF